MSKIKIEIKGHEHLKRSYYSKSIKVNQSTSRELTTVGKELKKYATSRIKKITGSKRQVRYNPKRTVRVSNPGSYPNHDRGELVKGLRTVTRNRGKGDNTLEFSSRAPYALDLEFGTRNMRARPYMRRTLQANSKLISRMLGKAVKRAL